MVTGYSLGYKIEYINNQWIYSDTKESIDKPRPCKYCGKYPTDKGYDGCLGYLPNVSSTCCGHGLGKSYVVFNDGQHKQFENVKKLKDYFKNERGD